MSDGEAAGSRDWFRVYGRGLADGAAVPVSVNDDGTINAVMEFALTEIGGDLPGYEGKKALLAAKAPHPMSSGFRQILWLEGEDD